MYDESQVTISEAKEKISTLELDHSNELTTKETEFEKINKMLAEYKTLFAESEAKLKNN